MDGLTVILPYFENQGMLKEQVDVFNSYPEDIRNRLELIIVDDCSPLGTRAEEILNELPLANLDFSLYRILTKVRWNWLQCRNLGASMAKHPWLLLTDIDHIIPDSTMAKVMGVELSKKAVFYTFPRVDYPKMTPYHPHPNSYLMTKKLYWRIGGYDETYAGHYGTDGMWRRRCEEHASHHFMVDSPIARVDRQVIPDASTVSLDRKDHRDPNALADVREFKEKHKLPVQTLRQPWKKIYGTKP